MGLFKDRLAVHIRRLAKLSLPLCVLGLLNACAVQPPDSRPLQLVSGSAPIYPAELKSRGTEGEVTVQYDVTAQGEVINVRVIASDPPGLFDDAALVAVRTWVCSYRRNRRGLSVGSGRFACGLTHVQRDNP